MILIVRERKMISLHYMQRNGRRGNWPRVLWPSRGYERIGRQVEIWGISQYRAIRDAFKGRT